MKKYTSIDALNSLISELKQLQNGKVTAKQAQKLDLIRGELKMIELFEIVKNGDEGTLDRLVRTKYHKLQATVQHDRLLIQMYTKELSDLKEKKASEVDIEWMFNTIEIWNRKLKDDMDEVVRFYNDWCEKVKLN